MQGKPLEGTRNVEKNWTRPQIRPAIIGWSTVNRRRGAISREIHRAVWCWSDGSVRYRIIIISTVMARRIHQAYLRRQLLAGRGWLGSSLSFSRNSSGILEMHWHRHLHFEDFCSGQSV